MPEGVARRGVIRAAGGPSSDNTDVLWREAVVMETISGKECGIVAAGV